MGTEHGSPQTYCGPQQFIAMTRLQKEWTASVCMHDSMRVGRMHACMHGSHYGTST